MCQSVPCARLSAEAMGDDEAAKKKKGAPLEVLMQFESLREERITQLRAIFDFVTNGSGVISCVSAFHRDILALLRTHPRCIHNCCSHILRSHSTSSAAEFGVVARAFGAQVSDEELEEIISELNVSGGGTIDFLDFCGLMVRQYSDQRDPEFTAAFHAIDADGDGTLSPEELRDAFAALGYEFNEVEIAEMASEADADGDGRLTLADFMFNCKSS